MALGASIAVGGAVDDELASASWIEVCERMGQPTTYRIRYEVEIGSTDFDRLVDARLDAGSVLSVLVPGGSAGGSACLVKGPVGGQYIHFEHGGPRRSYVEVRGNDTAITLDREAQSKIWSDATDDVVVAAIVQGYGLIPDAPTKADGAHLEAKHVLVQRESDLSFVRRLARRNGFLFWITCDALGVETAHFKLPPVTGEPALTLTINQTTPALDALDLRWDVERPTRVAAVQLDLNTGEDLDGSTADTSLTALGDHDLAAITRDTRSRFLATPCDDAGALAARSRGALIESSWFIRATGETRLDRAGAPIRAHTVIALAGAGARHSGNYFVAGVRHTIDPDSHRMELELVRNAWGG